MIYKVYETFLLVTNKRQNAPLDILGPNFFMGGACHQTTKVSRKSFIIHRFQSLPHLKNPP